MTNQAQNQAQTQNQNQGAESASIPEVIQTATALHQAGRLPEAERLYRQVLQMQPDNASVLHLLGLIAYQVGRHESAVELIANAIRRGPTGVMYCNLGLAFKALDKRELATECFRQAVALQPDFAEAHYQLGVALQEAGSLDEAVTSCVQAVALKPDLARAYGSLGDIYFSLGRFEQARAAISRLLELEPDTPLALALLARLEKMTMADEALLQKMVALLDRKGRTVPSEDSIALWFSIGKYYDDTRQYEAAFSAYHQANALRRQSNAAFDRAGLSRLVDAQIATYSAEFIRRHRDGSSVSERPVLIVGMPRSGTSLAEQIIASHPATFGAGELPFWVNTSLANPEADLYGRYDPGLLAKIAGEYEQLLLQKSAAASRVVDKLPGNFWRLGLISTVFPHARIIHMQRNPVDTCLSIYFQNFDANHPYATDLDDLAFRYREYVRLMRHWRKVLPADRFLDVPYEALTEDQEGWSRRIIDFLGLEWDARCLAFHETERKVGTASNWQARQKIYRTSKERWRHYEQHVGPLRSLLEREA